MCNEWNEASPQRSEKKTLRGNQDFLDNSVWSADSTSKRSSSPKKKTTIGNPIFMTFYVDDMKRKSSRIRETRRRRSSGRSCIKKSLSCPSVNELASANVSTIAIDSLHNCDDCTKSRDKFTPPNQIEINVGVKKTRPLTRERSRLSASVSFESFSSFQREANLNESVRSESTKSTEWSCPTESGDSTKELLQVTFEEDPLRVVARRLSLLFE
jgi:hypothetical protein